MASSSSRIGRVLQEGAGDGDALALAAGQARAGLADQGVVALRQLGDEVVRRGGLRRRLDLGLARRRAGRRRCWRAMVSSNRKGSWVTSAICVAQRGQGDLAHVVAVDA